MLLLGVAVKKRERTKTRKKHEKQTPGTSVQMGSVRRPYFAALRLAFWARSFTFDGVLGESATQQARSFGKKSGAEAAGLGGFASSMVFLGGPIFFSAGL